MSKKIFTEKAPAVIGPYSQAIDCGDMLFISGVMPIDPETNQLVENDIVVQSQIVMKNIKAILDEAGYEVNDVVKTTCFLSDISNFAKFNEVYAQTFTNHPARSCMAVKDLPKGALVEVEVIAHK